MSSLSIFIAIAILSVWIFYRYSPESEAQKTTRIAPEFDYTPQENPGESPGISLLLIDPGYVENSIFGVAAPFTDFRRSIGTDIEELLTTRGYTIRGPFQNYDEVVYADKKNLDLLIEVEIDIAPDFAGLRKKMYRYWRGRAGYYF